jgi:hypothetical protein
MKRLFLLSLVVSIFLLVMSCKIVEVTQPSSADPGEEIEIVVVVVDSIAETNNPHKGILSILVPNDWTFVSGTWEAQLNPTKFESGLMVTEVDSPFYADTVEACHPAESIFAGMKWITVISDSGHLHDIMVATATINLKVGQTTGTFPLGYHISIASKQMVCWELSGDSADTLWNQMITVGGTKIVEQQLDGIPTSFALSQNYPNPFNPTTKIRYEVKEPSLVKLAVYDLSGREVAILSGGIKQTGVYEVEFNAGDLASGVYVYRLTANNFTMTRKMALVR